MDSDAIYDDSNVRKLVSRDARRVMSWTTPKNTEVHWID